MSSVPEVSIIVPARNEESNLRICLSSLVDQAGVSFEIFVVDDHSEDRTREIAESFSGVQVIPARALENGWTGKTNAIETAVPLTHGQWFLFTDADTAHLPGSLERSLSEAKTSNVALLSFSPRQEVGTFWEQAVQPLIFSELSLAYSYDNINDPNSPAAAANGQYILVRREAYEQIGGHARVKGSLLEDVELARAIKQIARIHFRYGPDIVSARMYRNHRDLIEGWTKNLAGLFPHVFRLAILRAAEAGVLLCGPFFTLILIAQHPVGGGALGALVLLSYYNFASRLRNGGWPFHKALPSLLGLPLFSFLLLRSFSRYAMGQEVMWKGRAYRSG